MILWRTAVVSALVSALAGCGSQTRAPARDDGASGLSVRLADATVAVTGQVGGRTVHRSGTVVDARRGLVATVADGLWGARALTLDTTLGVLHARVTDASACAGVLLLAAQPGLPGLGVLTPAPGVATGGALSVAGFRRGTGQDGAAEQRLQLHETRGRRTDGPVTLGTDLPAVRDAWQLDVAVPPELGGGPVVDADRRLVALLAGGRDTPDLALDAGAVRALRARALAGDRSVPAAEAACRRARTAAAGGREPVLDVGRPAAPGPVAVHAAGATTPRVRPVRVPLDGVPTDVAVTGGAAWVTLAGSGRLVALDARTGAPLPSADSDDGPDPLRVVAPPGVVWTVGAAERRLRGHRTGAADAASTVGVALPGPAVAVAAGAGVVWVTGGDDGTLTRVDPVGGTVLGRTHVARDAAAVAAAGDVVWVLDPSAGTAVRVDGASGRRVGTAVPVGADLTALAVAAGTVWVADRAGGGRVTPLDAADGRRRAAPVAVGGVPVALAADGDRVLALVLDEDGPGARVVALHSGGGPPATVATLGGTPSALAAAGRTIWITDARAGEAVRLEG